MHLCSQYICIYVQNIFAYLFKASLFTYIFKGILISSTYITIYFQNTFAHIQSMLSYIQNIFAYVQSIFAYMLKICFSASLVYTSGWRQYCAERSQIKMLQFPFWIFYQNTPLSCVHFYFANFISFFHLDKILALHLFVLRTYFWQYMYSIPPLLSFLKNKLAN